MSQGLGRGKGVTRGETGKALGLNISAIAEVLGPQDRKKFHGEEPSGTPLAWAVSGF